MVTLESLVLRLTLLALLLGGVATVPGLAGSSVIGSVAGSRNATIGGQRLLANTTIFGGDSLEVRDGVAVIAVGNNDRVIFGRDTIASFLRDPNEVTVLLSQGNVSMLHPNDGTPLRVKAGEISITPAAGFKTLGEVAIVDGSVVITAREGALQVEDHGATKTVAMGQTIVIAPKTSKGGAAGTPAILGGVGVSGAGNATTGANQAVSTVDAVTPAAKLIGPASSRAIGAASAAAAGASSQAACGPPPIPKGHPASEIFPMAGTSGPICPGGGH
jgi:hypothetical protein